MSAAAPPDGSPADQEAELFAASTAEGAIAAAKAPPEAADLDALAVALERTALPADPPSADPAADPAVAADPADPADPPPAPAPEPERALTKDELVEEALSCPCIASMRDGPCGDPFITAYRCFLESDTEPKGMDCMDQFKTMQACIADHPDEYNLDDDDDDDGDGADPFAAQPTSATAAASAQEDRVTQPPQPAVDAASARDHQAST